MRARHFPRLCRSCEAPMARQEDSCWRCKAPWIDREPTLVTRRLFPGSLAAGRASTPERMISTTSSSDAPILVPA
jgi:hypothetical protein